MQRLAELYQRQIRELEELFSFDVQETNGSIRLTRNGMFFNPILM